MQERSHLVADVVVRSPDASCFRDQSAHGLIVGGMTAQDLAAFCFSVGRFGAELKREVHNTLRLNT